MRRLLALTFLVISAASTAGDIGIVSKPSRYSVSDTVSRLESVLKDKGMTIFAKIDHAEQAKQSGLDMRPMQLLVFGNPKGGTPVMKAAPLAGIDLPLKALVWQDGEGKVWLSYNSAAYLQERHDLPDGVTKPLAGIGTLLESAMQ